MLKIVRTKEGKSYLFPFILITSLFLLWGVAHSILDVLNKHFQDELSITKAKSAWVQAVVYGGYFLMALPAGALIKKMGYKWVVVLGLALYALGSFLFIPGSRLLSFPFFLFSLFIIGCGLTCLETAANPYITVLGDRQYSASRLNLAQAFNGLGWMLGPLLGGLFIFSEEGNLSTPYAWIGGVVSFVALLFVRVKLPEIPMEEEVSAGKESPSQKQGLWQHRHFKWGVVALFCYVAAQTGINSFFINYATESSLGIDNRTASLLLSFGGMGLFMLGRIGGSWLMNRIDAQKILFFFALGAALCMVLVVGNWGWISLGALFLCYLFESILFPTIFALAIAQLGAHTEKASSYLIMSIVGGAIAPIGMGYLGEENMSLGFLIPLVCFVIILGYGSTYSSLLKH